MYPHFKYLDPELELSVLSEVEGSWSEDPNPLFGLPDHGMRVKTRLLEIKNPVAMISLLSYNLNLSNPMH